jgi:hypothetical protein
MRRRWNALGTFLKKRKDLFVGLERQGGRLVRVLPADG